MASPTAVEVGRWLEGTTHGEADVADHFGVSQDEAERLVIGSGVERCEGCDWMFRKSDLSDTPTGFICAECRKERAAR